MEMERKYGEKRRKKEMTKSDVKAEGGDERKADREDEGGEKNRRKLDPFHKNYVKNT